LTSNGAVTKFVVSTSVAGWYWSRKHAGSPSLQRRTYVCRFITPSIFEKYSTPDWPVVDEWMLCEKLGQSNCAQALKPHWDSFVSLDDFWKIKNAGFNLVRIPVG